MLKLSQIGAQNTAPPHTNTQTIVNPYISLVIDLKVSRVNFLLCCQNDGQMGSFKR